MVAPISNLFKQHIAQVETVQWTVGSLTQSKESSNAWPCAKPCRSAKTGGTHYAHNEAAAAGATKLFLAFSVSLGSFSSRFLRDAVENYAT